MTAFLKLAGDYTNWNVYKKAEIISDVTELFILRAIEKPSRTIDQMRQAARSCKQNIVEGIGEKTVSTEMCIKLLGVARASARELREDYSDFLRQNDMEIWPLNDPRTHSTRQYCASHDDPADFVAKCRQRTDETVANIMLTLLKQIDSMLANTLKKFESEFIAEGGLKEAMTAARKAHRGY